MVWSLDMPQFNPAADLSDSIYQDQSGIYIARYIGITADYDNSIDAAKQAATGLSNSNATKANLLRRTMVKLNDASAVEKYTEFSVDIPEKEAYNGYLYSSKKPAFGARIIKPDSTIIYLDMNNALTVTEGKKNKDSEYKIAIPGLAPGDILDFFYYDEYMYDELSIPSFTVSFLARYPTRNFMLDCRIAPELAFEYGSYNGAPKITQFGKIDEKNHLFIEMEHIYALDESIPYFSMRRQMPFMDIHVLNNQARLEYVPKTARPGGIRHGHYAFLMADIASSINKCEIPGKLVNEASKITKDWCKLNPDANDRDKINTGWLALRYATIKSEEKVSERQFSIMFFRLLEKLKVNLEGRIGITSSRKQVPVKELIHFDDAEYMVMVGETCYLPSNNLLSLPGELPSGYDREEYVVFKGSPENENLQTMVEYGNLATTRAVNNSVNTVTSIKLSADNEDRLNVNSEVVFTGSQKDMARQFMSEDECVSDIEKYLGVKPIKRFKNFDEEAAQEYIKERMEKFANIIWNSDDSKVDLYSTINRGCTPDSPKPKITLSGNTGEAVTMAGNNLMVNIGRFIGHQKQIKDNERKREVSIVRSCPNKFDTTIIFEIPEGYELVTESLNDLNKSVLTAEATFNTETRVDGRTVTIRAVERYNHSIYPVSSWPNLMKVSDALHDFQSASIVLKPL